MQILIASKLTLSNIRQSMAKLKQSPARVGEGGPVDCIIKLGVIEEEEVELSKWVK